MTHPRRLAFLLPELKGGGAERVFIDLASYLTAQGHNVDLVVFSLRGEYADQDGTGVKTVDLQCRRAAMALPGLLAYLRENRPAVLFSTLDHVNLVAILARMVSPVKFRLAIRIANNLTASYRHPRTFRARFIPLLIRRFYRHADEILAVSAGVADDAARFCSIPRERIRAIHNPVLTPELVAKREAPWSPPFNATDGLPMVLGVGSLTAQKDFVTLIKAFALVRKQRPARLVILGEGHQRGNLMSAAAECGVEKDFYLPGFVDNPFVYMRHAAVFVLSSRWEGLPGVLIQALACGCPVVSTDCPSGPEEILAGGRYGSLVPVGDHQVMASAILDSLNNSHDPMSGMQRAENFKVDEVANSYLDLILRCE
jgi:glycosyltransferase involved in cell wall biosynthesis